MKLYFAPMALAFPQPTQETLTTSSYDSDWLDHVTPYVSPFTSGDQYDQSYSLCRETKFFVHNDCIRSCQAGDTICYKHCNEELISNLEVCCLLDQACNTNDSPVEQPSIYVPISTPSLTTNQGSSLTTNRYTTELSSVSNVETTQSATTTSTLVSSAETTIQTTTEDETETTYEPTTEMATSEIATTDTTSTTSTKAASSEVTFSLLTLYYLMNLL